MIRLPGRRVRYTLLLAGSAAAFLLAAPALPASADAPVADLDCTITVTVAVSPPLTLETEHVATTSNGLTGTADCTGTVDGQAVTGPGRFGVYSTLDVVACVNATSENTFVLRIPTTGGIRTVTGHYTAVSVAGVTTATGDFTGSIAIVPNGNCVIAPITSATSVLTGHIT
jgi:hypothetical protein